MAIAFDAAALKDEVDVAQMGGAEDAVAFKQAGNDIVEIGFEFSAPAIELEVEKDGVVVFGDGDGAEVTGPCIIGGNGGESDSAKIGLGLVKELAGLVRRVGDEDDPRMVAGVGDDGGEGFLDLGKIRLPVGGFMGPSHEYAILLFPLCW